MNILIAEDLPVTQMLHSKLMHRWGHVFDMASNGAEAVDYAIRNEGKYDLGLMDIEMPVMNGLEATRQIRQKVSYFPIMAYSANVAYRQPCLAGGFDAFVEKPAMPDTLFKKINELTVKSLLLYSDNAIVSIKQVTPMNAEQLKELRELEKKGLAVLIVEQGSQRFVVHKNIQNKMSHVLIGEGKELFEFLDRGENPANCHLYKCNMQTNRLLLTPEQFAQRSQAENADIENFTATVDQSLEAQNKK